MTRPATADAALSCITLSTEAGLEVDVLPFGAYISAIRCFGQQLTLSYPTPAYYQHDPYYLGATVGRYANRIRQGRFYLDQQLYQLDTNANGHCLHGGAGQSGALHQQHWQLLWHSTDGLQLYLLSPQGSCGFPGEVQLWCTIMLKDSQLYCEYKALSDQDTVLNLTNHCYFNLNSDGGSIDNHLLQSDASHYLPTDADTLPTGDICAVAGTVFDFQQPTALSQRLQQPALHNKSGFDHCLVWPKAANSSELQWRASLWSPQSGVQLRLFSNKPGLQLYTGQYLATPFLPRQGLCLEPQHWPDAPNQPHFPPALLKAGQWYQHQLCYQFLQKPDELWPTAHSGSQQTTTGTKL
ncbi:aldose epimerase family protein [Rheinheimera sp. 4Y26]|uniref:aldose epimerase family protein n=1 Tax=Rheinheimera sp. 4Y26 TaxID=2977811 RepID=UPI0021B0B9A9|nr:aldose epimerase family protein [Rheinheimera sp. 4Y26]MCT6698624.1 galactose mutarotase [Rheinheimera sp. 4Y26]